MSIGENEIFSMNARELLSEETIYRLYDIEDTGERERRIANFSIRAKELDVEKELSRVLKTHDRIDKELQKNSGINQNIQKFEGKQLSILIVQDILIDLGITVRYNRLLKEIEINGLPAAYSCENAVNTLPVYLMDCLKMSGIKGVTQSAVESYLTCIADQNRFNPLEEYLNSIAWDNTDRLQKVFDILGITELRYCTYIMKWLIQCVALGLNDQDNPVGAEGILVLQGEQGTGKTSFFRKLSPYPQWFVEGAVVDMQNKDTLINVLSGWICELGELDSTLKREQSALKAFVTRSEDRIRLPYAKSATRSSRYTSFCGTVNPKEYLRDESGTRRFWTIPIQKINKKKLFSINKNWIDQLWAQVYNLYLSDKSSFRLSDDDMRELQEENHIFDMPLPYETDIRERLDWNLPPESWQWWKSSDLIPYLRANPTAYQVGKVLVKISREEVYRGAFAYAVGVLDKEEGWRISHGTKEFYLPLKRY